MNTRTLGAALACIAAVALVGCDPAATEPTPDASAATEPATAAPARSATEEPPAQPKAVPNFIGMGLQSAQDTAQAEGFYLLKSHDSAGRDRLQALDRNWKVCSQNVAPGKVVPTDTTLDFGAVKLAETCPAADKREPEAAAGKMPDLTGESVKAARNALDSGTSITVTDAAEGRMVLMESNWKVCSQSPSPGTALNGQPVEFSAVKFDESC
ncbi:MULTISPECIES: PASTA domain-containing protein [Streptomyces]|uniref:PASTA domain-containing protein n=1 Tax=Streptomyces TaxID=1883 RepID=UPI001CC2A3C7|nr:PASTA domain-containing protein [Streptomyces sp. JV180]